MLGFKMLFTIKETIYIVIFFKRFSNKTLYIVYII